MSGSSSSSSSTSTSRKGKKNNSDKPKQPQRGLGVAQLEKIRLHGQIASNNYHPNSFITPYPTTNFTQEDVRIQTTYSSLPSSSYSYSCSSSSPTSYGYHPCIPMGSSDYEKSTIIYGDSQPTATASWNPAGTGISETQHFTQPNTNRHNQNLPAEDQEIKRIKKNRSNSMGSSSQNSESSDTQDVDLELRLSI